MSHDFQLFLVVRQTQSRKIHPQNDVHGVYVTAQEANESCGLINRIEAQNRSKVRFCVEPVLACGALVALVAQMKIDRLPSAAETLGRGLEPVPALPSLNS